jgi:hypothetical protein
MARSWPSLVAMAVDLIDWRRWNLSVEQFQFLLKAGEAGRSHPWNNALYPPGKVLLRHPNGGGFSWGGRAFKPDTDGLVTAPADAAKDMAVHGFRPWCILDQVEREFRVLFRSGKIELRGVDSTTGAAKSLPAEVAPIAIFRFDANEIKLPGAGALRLVAISVERSTSGAAPSDKEPKSDHRSGSGRRKGRRKTASRFWRAAEIEAMRWLDDNGCPEPWDGGQAKLEDHIKDWLAARGRYPAESTVRSHVRKCIDEFRNRLASLTR